jgi:hypothetical protein
MGKGLPQIYGTQLISIDGRWTLEPFDRTAVTDEERARWAVLLLKSVSRRWKRSMPRSPRHEHRRDNARLG